MAPKCPLQRGSTVFLTNLAYVDCISCLGTIPYDGVPREEIITIHPAVSSIYIILACAGIGFAIACLVFNFVYRTAKYANSSTRHYVFSISG